MPDKKKRCDRCGGDLTLFRKIITISNTYYNLGLAKAKVRDLSGAIFVLKKSLELDKYNTNARNLLGLIYFEMGETVAALSEWVISKHFKAENNDADEYMNAVQDNPTKLDTLNQAIKKFNTALISAKQGSGDLAIIQLKKVTALTPHFIRAFLLLALLYMKQGDNEKAKKCLVKVSKIDVSNTTTLRYIKELDRLVDATKDPGNNQEKEGERDSTPSYMPISSYKEDKPNIMAFVNLVIGIIIGVAVMYFLVIPTINKGSKVKGNQDYVEYSEGLTQQEANDETIKDLQQEKKDLEEVVDQLRDQIDSTVIPEVNIEMYDPLFEAVDLYISELSKENANDRDLIAVADAVLLINSDAYETEAANKILNLLKTATYTEAALSYYEKGHDLYNDNKFEEGLVQLEKAFSYDPTNIDVLYFMARSYQQLEDNENAALYYNIVITDYPDSNRASQAKRYVEEVQ